MNVIGFFSPPVSRARSRRDRGALRVAFILNEAPSLHRHYPASSVQ